MPQLPPIKRFVSTTGVRVYRIACEVLPGLTGRVYLLVGAGPTTLVDTGSGEGESTGQILAGLEAVARDHGEGARATDVRRILITHAHIDHIGGLGELVRRTGAEVGVHALDRRFITAWDERATLYNRALRGFFRAAGVPQADQSGLIQAFGVLPGRVESVAVNFHLREQNPLDGLQFLHVPGHSPGHVAIRAGNLLLCGDHVLPRTVPQPWPESILPYTGLGHYLESLSKLARLEGIELALGGHEPPMDNLGQRIAEIRASHMRRLERLLDLLAKADSPLTVQGAAEKMYSHAKGFQAFLALTDVAARMEYLDQRGRLELANREEVERDDFVAHRYRPVGHRR